MFLPTGTLLYHGLVGLCMVCLLANSSCVQMVKVGIQCTMQQFKSAVLIKDLLIFVFLSKVLYTSFSYWTVAT